MDIDSAATREQLIAATIDCLENMAFLEVAPTEEKCEFTEGMDIIWSSVPVISPFSAKLVVCCQTSMARQIADNIYGPVCDEITEAMVKDVMGELANTIVGKLMGHLVPAGQTFSLDVPSCGNNHQNFCSDGEVDIRFAAGDDSFTVVFSLD